MLPCFRFSPVFLNVLFLFSVTLLEGTPLSTPDENQCFPYCTSPFRFFFTIISSIICRAFHTRFPLNSTHLHRVSSKYVPKLPRNVLSVPIFTSVLRNDQVVGPYIVILLYIMDELSCYIIIYFY